MDKEPLKPIRDTDWILGPGLASDPEHGAWGKTRVAIDHLIELEQEVQNLRSSILMTIDGLAKLTAFVENLDLEVRGLRERIKQLEAKQ